MHKYGVVTDKTLLKKTASSRFTCPACNSGLVALEGSVIRCLKCGTEPYENIENDDTERRVDRKARKKGDD